MRTQLTEIYIGFRELIPREPQDPEPREACEHACETLRECIPSEHKHTPVLLLGEGFVNPDHVLLREEDEHQPGFREGYACAWELAQDEIVRLRDRHRRELENLIWWCEHEKEIARGEVAAEQKSAAEWVARVEAEKDEYEGDAEHWCEQHRVMEQRLGESRAREDVLRAVIRENCMNMRS